MSNLTGIIPAAGRGTRMAGSDRHTPKALIEVEGKALIESAIESLVSIGVSKIVVVIGHRSAEVSDYFAARDFPVQIEFAHQETQLGLAHAIATTSDLL